MSTRAPNPMYPNLTIPGLGPVYEDFPVSAVYLCWSGVTWSQSNPAAEPLTCRGVTPGLPKGAVDQLSPKGVEVTFDKGWVRHASGSELCLGQTTRLAPGASSGEATELLGEPDSKHDFRKDSRSLQAWGYGAGMLVLSFEVDQENTDDIKLVEVRLSSKLAIETLDPDKSDWEIVSY